MRIGQQHHKLFTTPACQQIGGAQCLSAALADFNQHLIAHAVAMQVIDALEVVHIQYQQGHRQLVPLRQMQLALHTLQKMPPVAQSGEAVGHGECVCPTTRLLQCNCQRKDDCASDQRHRQRNQQGNVKSRPHLLVAQKAQKKPGQRQRAQRRTRAEQQRGLPNTQSHHTLRETPQKRCQLKRLRMRRRGIGHNRRLSGPFVGRVNAFSRGLRHMACKTGRVRSQATAIVPINPLAKSNWPS